MAVLGGYMASGQKLKEEAVPAEVKAGFTKQFPTANHVTWEKEKGGYEAGFRRNNTQYAVTLDAKGTVLETETGIDVQLLPQPVNTYLRKNYPGVKITEAARITNRKGEVTYEAEVKGKDLIFDKSGKLIKP